MSYDISIKSRKHGNSTIDLSEDWCKKASVRSFDDYGGTIRLGGTSELATNITWNYGDIFRRPEIFGEDGIRALYNIPFNEAYEKLVNAIATLSVVDTTKDPWKTPDYSECDEEFRPKGYWVASVENVLISLVHLKFLMDLARSIGTEDINEDFYVEGD